MAATSTGLTIYHVPLLPGRGMDYYYGFLTDDDDSLMSRHYCNCKHIIFEVQTDFILKTTKHNGSKIKEITLDSERLMSCCSTLLINDEQLELSECVLNRLLKYEMTEDEIYMLSHFAGAFAKRVMEAKNGHDGPIRIVMPLKVVTVQQDEETDSDVRHRAVTPDNLFVSADYYDGWKDLFAP